MTLKQLIDSVGMENAHLPIYFFHDDRENFEAEAASVTINEPVIYSNCCESEIINDHDTTRCETCSEQCDVVEIPKRIFLGE
uniref:Uncharacterized protein n=1 Tax=viral metagenome TaxID=1070528 RepID=A0A6H2A493_9ZZZZ